jgi:hypothetical protein
MQVDAEWHPQQQEIGVNMTTTVDLTATEATPETAPKETKAKKKNGEGPPKRLSLDWWARQYGLSRRKLNGDIAAGKLRAIRFSRRTLITGEDFAAYLDSHATSKRGKDAQ